MNLTGEPARYGTLGRADAVAPAIALAGRGVLVRPHMRWFWSLLAP